MDTTAPTLATVLRTTAVALAVAAAVLVAGSDPASAAGRRPGVAPVTVVSVTAATTAPVATTTGLRGP